MKQREWEMSLDVFTRWFLSLDVEKQVELSHRVSELLDYSAKKTEMWLDRNKFADFMEGQW